MSTATLIQQTTWLSPAKLNLFLHILGRYESGPYPGYHDLQTLMQFIDCCDEMLFTLRQDTTKTTVLTAHVDIVQETNLAYRAAELLRASVSHESELSGVEIHINKKIPVGGGVGGGSSNAATTLLIMNELWQLHLDITTLLQLGLRLGADVPFFIAGHAALAEGIGDKLITVTPPESTYLVLVPPVEVPTVKIYNDPGLTRNGTKVTIASVLKGPGRNDCAAVVCEHYPPVQEAMTWLSQYTDAHLTGSGGCVFGAFADKMSALHVLEKVKLPFKGMVVQGLNISPLHQQMTNIIGVSPSGKAQGFDPCIPRFES